MGHTFNRKIKALGTRRVNRMTNVQIINTAAPLPSDTLSQLAAYSGLELCGPGGIPERGAKVSGDYTAANIRILEPQEVRERWNWANAAQLATRYKRHQGWIAKGLRACEAVGIPRK